MSANLFGTSNKDTSTNNFDLSASVTGTKKLRSK